MKAKFTGSWGIASRANLALALTLLATGSALAAQATPEQKKACTPDVYRLCPGEIPNVRAITSCLRRQKASLSDACRAVFEQWSADSAWRVKLRPHPTMDGAKQFAALAPKNVWLLGAGFENSYQDIVFTNVFIV
jgi:hypothetical protein